MIKSRPRNIITSKDPAWGAGTPWLLDRPDDFLAIAYPAADFLRGAGGAQQALKSLDKSCYLTAGGLPRYSHIMGNELTINTELDAEPYGPKMAALAPLQQKLVLVYLEHPTWGPTALAKAAGYADSSAQVRGSINLRDPRVIAAINEEGERHFNGTGAAIALMGTLKLALNEGHKDHRWALEAILNRTGHHALSEHKVIVDDKRPETHAEMLAFVKNAAAELKLSPQALAELTGEKIVDVEFEEVTAEDAEIDAAIAAQMEDL